MDKPKPINIRNSKSIAAFDKRTLGFISFFKNPTSASKSLFDTPLHQQRIKKCANHEIKYVKDYIFEWIDNDNFTAEGLDEIKNKILKRKNIPLYQINKYGKNKGFIVLNEDILKKTNLKVYDKVKILLKNNQIIIEKF